jgi:outer membrane receptor for ferrienterochelin and colicin
MNSFRSSSALTLSLFAVLLLTPALAQAQKKSSPRGLVTAEDIAKYPNDSIERIIARKVPGVDVVRAPSGGNMLRIRGAVTLPDAETGTQVDKAPLYVVDGVPIRTPDGSLPPLEPQDLDSVRVLKGTETAVWGVEGADGVIVFTTKRGKLRNN